MWKTFLLSWEASKSECHLNDILSTADNRILGKIEKMMGKINFKNDNGIIFNWQPWVLFGRAGYCVMTTDFIC